MLKQIPPEQPDQVLVPPSEELIGTGATDLKC